MTNQLDISVVVPTHNRVAGLSRLLDRLADQDADGIRYEVVVVDNNSTDDTRAVVERAIARDAGRRLRYVFEPRQGVSYARNTGIERTTAPLIAFLDDDGIPGPDWVRGMKRAFEQHSEADCIGGRVRADWRVPAPSWMQQAHTGPLALQDWPDMTVVNARSAWICLITANLGFRRDVFTRIGGFSPDFPRNQDRELQLRMWRAGMHGLYVPALDVTVVVPPERLTRRYHRRWRATTGKYQALMRFRDSIAPDGGLRTEPHRGRTLLGSPLFIYRELLSHLRGWCMAVVRLRSDDRFFHETRIWYCVGFVNGRWREGGAGRTVNVPVLQTRPASPDTPQS